MRSLQNQLATPRTLSALLLVALLLAASPLRADEPKSYQDANQPSTAASGQGIRAPDPRKINQAPKAEDFVNDGDKQLRDLEPTDADESGGMSQVRMPEERAPKIDAPQQLSPVFPNGTTLTPYSPLVKVNKSGVKPQVLKKPKGAGSVKGMGMTFTTNLQTGSASMSVPFALPPARAGLGPSLGLSYSSGGAQGVAGLGWSFGVGFIGRQTDQGLPRYDDEHNTDRFVYNGGRELVRVNNSTTTMPDWPGFHPDTPYYRAKIEGLFMRFFRMTDDNGDIYWKAQDTNGTIYWFGGTDEDGVIPSAVICDSNCDRIFRWNLVRVRDLHQNRVEYNYFKDRGQSYLRDVYYVNKEPDSPASEFQHHVAIFYQTRPDVLTSYQPGYPVTTAERIDEVRIYTDYGAIPNPDNHPMDIDSRRLVRAYDLRYDATLLHTMLEEVQMFGKDNTTGLPPVRFEYSTVAGTQHVSELGYINGEVQSLAASPADSMGDGRRDLLDIDADGLPDVFETDPTNPGSLQKYILNAGTSLPEGNKLPMSGGQNQALYNTNVRIMDMDGDGKAEMVHMPHVGRYTVYYLQCDEVAANQTGETRTCRWEAPNGDILVNPSIDFTTDAADYKLLDINGDHLIDIVRTTGTQMQHWINLGAYENGEGKFGHVDPASGNLSDQPITSCVLHKGLPVQFSDARVKLADMNGDGLQDIVLVDYGDLVYWPNKGFGNWGTGGTCSAGTFGSNRHISMADAPMFSNMDVTKIHLGDINGDGLADMMQIRFDAVDVWLNAIDGFKPRAILDNSPTAPQFTDRVRLADINGSGSRDIVWGDGGNYRYIDLTGGVKPRLLIRAHNGLGGITEVDYEPSTDQYLADREDGREWTTTCPFPSQVVKEVRTRDQFDVVPDYDESIYIKRYRYSDCYYDGEEHKHRGFAEVTEEAVGDENSPTSYVTHHYYQGKPGESHIDYTLESLAGAEYRTDVYSYDSDNGQPDGASPRIYLSTKFTSYAVRKVLDSDPADLIPGLHPDKARTVRFSYAAESHSFGYNTHEQYEGGLTPASYSSQGLLNARVEEAVGSSPADDPVVLDTGSVALDLPFDVGDTTYIKSEKHVTDYGQTKLAKAHGVVGQDNVIASYSQHNQNEARWIHRVCETYVRDDADTTTHYNHTRQAYDGETVTWTDAAGSYTCAIGTLGENTSSEIRAYYSGTFQVITAHQTVFTRWGLPTHTKALKKIEGWVYYEDPRGYEALPTREVIRVGTNESTPDYDETPVKYLTIRVSYDPGMGTIVKYWDENEQESRAVYDVLGRITSLWGPREPTAGCAATFMKAAQVEYHLTTDPAVQPYSYVKATAFENACDPSDVKEVWSFGDGLGRVRLMVGPGDFANEYIGSGHRIYDAKGKVKESFGPAFMGGATQPGFNHSAPAIEGAIQKDCPTDNSCIQVRDSACSATKRYDAFGRAIETTQPNGVKTRTEFHGPLVTKAFDGNDTDPNSEFHNTPSTSTKDGHGRLASVKQVYVNTQKSHTGNYFKGYEHDVLGNLIVYMECTDGQKTSWNSCYTAGTYIEKLQHFDTVGRRREIVDPDAGTWTFVYDESNNIVETTDGKYNASGGSGGNQIGYTYDDANRLILETCLQCETRPAGDILARYYYDSPQTMLGGRGHMALPESTGPADDEPQDWVLGRLVRIEDDTGWVMFSYDRLGRQVTEAQHIEGRILNGGDGILDSDDDIIEGNDLVYIGRVEHDDAGRITRLSYPAPSGMNANNQPIVPLEVRYEYNLRGLTSRIVGPDPLGAGDYVYLEVDAAQPYNASGQRMDYRYGDASLIQHTKRYDNNGRLCEATAAQMQQVDPNRPLRQLLHKTYSFDAASNIKRIDDLRSYADVDAYTGGGNRPYHLVIEHDSLYRVTGVTYLRTPDELTQHPNAAPFRRKMTYCYNALGNLTERATVRGDADGTQTVNPPEEFYEKWLAPLGELAADGLRPHAFGSAAPASIDADVVATYDANGNMRTLTVRNDEDPQNPRYERFEYFWNHYHQLLKIEKYTSLGGTHSAVLYNAYDSGGQRVIKSEESDGAGVGNPQNTLYVTDGVELRNDQYIRYVKDGTQKVARIGLSQPYAASPPSVNETRLVYVADHLGSTSVVVMDHDDTTVTPGSDDRGCVVSTTSHLPYGGMEAETGAAECGMETGNWYKFTGKELEKSHGVYYFGARWMNPSLGAFTSADKYGVLRNHGQHLYGYVDGRLYNAVDPDGNLWTGVVRSVGRAVRKVVRPPTARNILRAYRKLYRKRTRNPTRYSYLVGSSKCLNNAVNAIRILHGKSITNMSGIPLPRWKMKYSIRRLSVRRRVAAFGGSWSWLAKRNRILVTDRILHRTAANSPNRRAGFFIKRSVRVNTGGRWHRRSYWVTRTRTTGSTRTQEYVMLKSGALLYSAEGDAGPHNRGFLKRHAQIFAPRGNVPYVLDNLGPPGYRSYGRVYSRRLSAGALRSSWMFVTIAVARPWTATGAAQPVRQTPNPNVRSNP